MRVPGIARLSMGLVALTSAILLVLDLAGLLPRTDETLLRDRMQICESLGVQAVVDLERGDYASVRALLAATARRHDEVLSAGYRDAAGRLLAATRGHRDLWRPEGETSTISHARVPIVSGGRRTGTLEVRFDDVGAATLLHQLWSAPVLRLLLATAISGFFAYLLYMRRALRFLDPGSVIPPRVQAALDVMAEGVLLIDRTDQIVLANSAFAGYLDVPAEKLLGMRTAELAWRVPHSNERLRELPWQPTLRSARALRGVPVSLEGADGGLTLMVSAAPVLREGGESQGAIITFDDVTALEQRSHELQRALAELEKSRDEIRMQNEELRVLASSDPLTGAANRRTFLARLARELTAARLDATPLCVVMVDIDHFKRVNDDHGHAVGDTVISDVAGFLLESMGDREIVCRYGGEEFCVALLGTNLDGAEVLAEGWRRRIAAEGFSEVPVSASFGISCTTLGAPTAEGLIEEADQALYRSKETGRNQVTRADRLAG